jgi:hypothetical protein
VVFESIAPEAAIEAAGNHRRSYEQFLTRLMARRGDPNFVRSHVAETL